MSAWKKYKATEIWTIPSKAGVYVIYLDSEPVYVGQSVNIRNRFNGHNIRHGYDNSIHLPWGDVPSTVNVTAKIGLSKKYGDWAMRELRLIRRLQPKFNKKGKSSY